MNKLNVEYMGIETLIPYINNPRKNEKAIDIVAGSIKEFGFKNPIIVDKDNIIVAGHTRYEASKKLDLKEVPVIKADDLSERQIKAFRIADNKTAEFAEWNMDLLAIELEDMGDIFTGFEAVELEDIMGTDEVEDDFNEEEALEEVKVSISQRGDVWLLGNHRLMCGDSTSEEDVKTLMDNRKCDLIITDPPYNVAVNDESEESLKARNRRKDGLKIENDNMSDKDFSDFLLEVYKRCFEISKDGGSIYVFYADSEVISFVSKFKEAGFHFAQNCIWNKQQFVMTRKDYHYKHEPIIYGWKKGAAHNWYSDRKQSSVWDFDRPFKNELHPTMKPIPLLCYPIKNSSKPNDLVVDLFGGSGSTLIAADQINRTCYTMEYDSKYVDVIVNRYIKTKESDEDVYLIRNGKEIKYKDLEFEK